MIRKKPTNSINRSGYRIFSGQPDEVPGRGPYREGSKRNIYDPRYPRTGWKLILRFIMLKKLTLILINVIIAIFAFSLHIYKISLV